MKTAYLLLFIVLLFTKCKIQKDSKKQKPTTSLDFSYSDVFSTCFSIKFTESDTVFIWQHFARSFSDTPRTNMKYYALLTTMEKNTIDSFIENTNFLAFDSLYYQSYEDGLDYQYFVDYGTKNKLIRIHSDSVPSQLEKMRIWITTTKKKLLLHQIDTSINFGSLKDFLPPEHPDPTKFTTPKVEQ